jgi:DNA-binding CsgD family transcriptional regulator
VTASVDVLLDAGRAALRAGDAAGARRILEASDTSPGGDIVECLARAAYIELDFDRAIGEWEQAYALHQESGDRLAAIRVARTLGYMHGTIRGDGAVMSGWLARARTLLADEEDSAEAGWVALNHGMFQPDRDVKHAQLEEAIVVGRRLHDSDLEFVALAYLGASLVHVDRTEEGMVLLDEALAAVAGRDVDDFCVLQEIFCQLFAACEHAHDVSRADQWIRVGEEIAARRRLPAVSAFCRTHYGGLLTAAGRWPEADLALTDAIRLWSLGHRSLRAGALARLADLRVRQGRFEEAEQLLGDLEGEETARPRAAIQLARGNTSLARDTLERALVAGDGSSTAAAPLIALLVDVHLAAGALDDARLAVERLDACASRHGGHFVAASAALARGRVCLATGAGDPATCLREALLGFGRAQMPVEVAHTRLALATALVADSPEVALAEARAALDAFERLQAARYVDAATALLRSLGVRSSSGGRPAGLLSKREAEVLQLLGLGLSNPDISDRLFISRKTVEHHVGNILAKLGLRTRGEAAAFATRTKAGGE